MSAAVVILDYYTGVRHKYITLPGTELN